MLLTLIVTTSLYLGEIRNEWIDILLRADGKEVLGATYRRRDKTLRAITGTADGDHVVLHEWTEAGVQSATIDARVTDKNLRGTWNHNLFEFWIGGHDPSSLGSASSWPVFDDLHDAIVTQRWDEAMLRAQLACALYYEGCEWLPIVRSRRVPVLPLPCDSHHRMGCLFARDQLYNLPFNARSEPARPLCDQYRIACVEAWGATEVELCEAAARGDAARVEELLARHPNVNAGGGALVQPLPAAVQAMSFPVVKLLIEHGADPNSVRLDAAVANNADDITLYLLDHGAKPEEVLGNAVYFGKRSIVQKALEKGASIGEGELITATGNRDVRMVRLLVAHCGYTRLDESPIDYARKIGAKKILNVMLNARNGPCAQSWQ